MCVCVALINVVSATVLLGGTLKIYGNFICPEVPYKTLLLSVTDNAFNVVKETLEKYKLEKENPNDYCLVKVCMHPWHAGDEQSTVL